MHSFSLSSVDVWSNYLGWSQIAQYCWFNIIVFRTTSLFLFNEAEINNTLNQQCYMSQNTVSLLVLKRHVGSISYGMESYKL